MNKKLLVIGLITIILAIGWYFISQQKPEIPIKPIKPIAPGGKAEPNSLIQTPEKDEMKSDSKPDVQRSISCKAQAGPNQKTYCSTVYGYEIIYPSYWVKNNFPDGNSRLALEYKDALISLSPGGHGLPFELEIKKSKIELGGKIFEVLEAYNGKNLVFKSVFFEGAPSLEVQKHNWSTLDPKIIEDFDNIIRSIKFHPQK